IDYRRAFDGSTIGGRRTRDERQDQRRRNGRVRRRRGLIVDLRSSDQECGPSVGHRSDSRRTNGGHRSDGHRQQAPCARGRSTAQGSPRLRSARPPLEQRGGCGCRPAPGRSAQDGRQSRDAFRRRQTILHRGTPQDQRRGEVRARGGDATGQSLREEGEDRGGAAQGRRGFPATAQRGRHAAEAAAAGAGQDGDRGGRGQTGRDATRDGGHQDATVSIRHAGHRRLGHLVRLRDCSHLRLLPRDHRDGARHIHPGRDDDELRRRVDHAELRVASSQGHRCLSYRISAVAADGCGVASTLRQPPPPPRSWQRSRRRVPGPAPSGSAPSIRPRRLHAPATLHAHRAHPGGAAAAGRLWCGVGNRTGYVVHADRTPLTAPLQRALPEARAEPVPAQRRPAQLSRRRRFPPPSVL
ncbi:hypothetical protein PENTCL1PPCAC_4232, partial [Pristionchus entomophagus]